VIVVPHGAKGCKFDLEKDIVLDFAPGPNIEEDPLSLKIAEHLDFYSDRMCARSDVENSLTTNQKRNCLS
jgi:hypothetical protein